MAAFRKEHCTDLTVEEMVLDSDGGELSKAEIPEVLSYLPDLNGKVVLELVAGTGCYTSELAKIAKKVIAVDSTVDCLEKNKEKNRHLGNCEFKHDVTNLEMPNESVDVVFSSWILLDLDNGNVEDLFRKQLRWLKPGGLLFFRETCRQTSTNIQKGPKPTKCRDIEEYEAFYSACFIPCDEKHFYGYDLVLSKSMDACSKVLNENSDIIWLLEKVKKDNSKFDGCQCLQDFLDKRLYSNRDILLYEKIFGRAFSSTGGNETAKMFAELLSPQKGQRLLDVGSGLGGVSFYLTKNYEAFVVSVDLSSNMFKLAQERAREAGCGRDQVVLEMADVTKRDYPAASFDAVFSHHAFYHIEDKLALLKRFYKILKPGGKVLISDHCNSPIKEYSESVKTLIRERNYHLLTFESYIELLKQAGFVNIKAEDKSEQMIDFVKIEISTSESLKDDIVQEFSESDYKKLLKSRMKKLGDLERGETIWGLFYAEKP